MWRWLMSNRMQRWSELSSYEDRSRAIVLLGDSNLVLVLFVLFVLYNDHKNESEILAFWKWLPWVVSTRMDYGRSRWRLFDMQMMCVQ